MPQIYRAWPPIESLAVVSASSAATIRFGVAVALGTAECVLAGVDILDALPTQCRSTCRECVMGLLVEARTYDASLVLRPSVVGQSDSSGTIQSGSGSITKRRACTVCWPRRYALAIR